MVVLLLLAGAGALATLPYGAGAIRVGSLSLLWWYGAVVAPAGAATITAVVLGRRPRSQSPIPPAAPST